MTDSEGRATRDDRGAYVSRSQRAKLARHAERTPTKTLTHPLADIPTAELEALQPEGIKAELQRRVAVEEAAITDNAAERIAAAQAASAAREVAEGYRVGLSERIIEVSTYVHETRMAVEDFKLKQKYCIKVGAEPVAPLGERGQLWAQENDKAAVAARLLTLDLGNI